MTPPTHCLISGYRGIFDTWYSIISQLCINLRNSDNNLDVLLFCKDLWKFENVTLFEIPSISECYNSRYTYTKMFVTIISKIPNTERIWFIKKINLLNTFWCFSSVWSFVLVKLKNKHNLRGHTQNGL